MTVQYEELYKRLEKLGGYDLEKINRAYIKYTPLLSGCFLSPVFPGKRKPSDS